MPQSNGQLPPFDFANLIPDQSKAAGVWRRYHPDYAFEVLIAYMDRPEYERALVRARKEIRGASNRSDEEGILQRRRSARAMAQAIVLDWRGLTEGGEAVPYSPEAAEERLNRSGEFFAWVINEANDLSTFREEAAEEAVGNSVKSSAGSSPTEDSGTRSEPGSA